MSKIGYRWVRVAVMMILIVLLAGCSASTNVPPTPFHASVEDLEAIRQTASDYIDGWYEGNAERMERSLYDLLTKRWITSNRVDTTTKWEMIDMTKAGGGKNVPGEKKNTITILDVYGNIAMVKTDSAEYVDYLQLGKVDGKWIIINVLWAEKELK
jgi:hypothetical protein